MRDITLEDTIFPKFTTRAFGTGIPTVLAGSPVISVYENDNLTQITAGVTLGVDHDGVVGYNMITVVATAANGFENGKEYSLVITTGTVGGVSVVGEEVHAFTIGSSAAAADLANGTDGLTVLKTSLDDIPTVSEFNARTILSADYFDPTADTVDNVTTVATLTGHTAQTGDGYAIVNDPTFGNEAISDNINNIANIGAAIHVSVIPSPNGFVLTTGSELNNEDDTIPLDGTRHELSDAAGTLDGVYKFDIGGDAVPVQVTFTGVYNSNNDDFVIEANTGTDGTPVWVQLGTLNGTNLAGNVVRPFTMFNNMIVQDIAGQVQVRVSGTGLTSASFDSDQIFVSKSSTSRSVGYAGGQIWINTLNGTAGTVPFFNGVADKAVLTLTDALTLSSSVGLTDFHILNGSTIQLSASSDHFSFFGDNWILDLNGQSASGAYFQGASNVSGICTGTDEIHFEGCDVNTISVQIGHFDFCGFDETVTHTLAGDYNYHNCYSKVAGVGGATFTKTAGQVITAQWRNWAGSLTLSGVQASDVYTISGSELGDIVINGVDGTVKILGQTESVTDNRTGSPVLVRGDFVGSDVTDTLADTNELQGDWVDGGRLDLILDSRMAEASIDTTGGAIDNVILVDTTTTNTDMVGTDGANTTTPPTVAAIADGVWDELQAGHTTANTFGKFLDVEVSSVSGGGGLTQQNVRDAMKLAPTVGSPAVGSVDEHLDDILEDTNDLQTSQGDWLTATGFATTAEIADVPTVAEFNARTLLAANYFDPTTDAVATVTTLTNLPSIPANWLTATGIAASALDGKGDWNIGKTGYSLTQSFPTNFADMAITVTTGKVTVGTNDDKTGYSIAGTKNTLDDLNDITAANVWAVATRVLTAGTNIVLAKGVGLTGLNDLSFSDVWTTQLTESYAADGVAPTPAQALFLMQQFPQDFAITGTSYSVKKLDGTTVAATFTLDDASNPTSITRSS